jgi:hypothetical protein
MTIQGLPKAHDYRASVLAERFGLTIGEARIVKGGANIEVDDPQALVDAGLVRIIEEVDDGFDS